MYKLNKAESQRNILLDIQATFHHVEFMCAVSSKSRESDEVGDCGGRRAGALKLLKDTSESVTQIQVSQKPNERPRSGCSPRVLELVGRRQMPSVKLGSQ